MNTKTFKISFDFEIDESMSVSRLLDLLRQLFPNFKRISVEQKKEERGK